MAGKKRTAAEDTGRRETRSSKVAKTEGSKTAGKAAKGTARLKTSLAQSAFKSRAVPLHASITTTTSTQESVSADPGFLASTTLAPTTFSTGSFGWKGHKRMVVELPGVEGETEAEKVHVTLTINATVIGSKDSKEEHEEGHHDEGAGEHVGEEVHGGESKHPEELSPEHSEAKEGEDKLSSGGEHTED